ncbi:MAG: hypothetical protein KJ811_01095, partial [Candidatus Margulisbacteria bacterium]|nr:hypothetical protein [Candidatus Margulisiibacteriota bacterium]
GLTFSRTSAYFCNFPVVFARPLSVLLDLIGRAPFAVVINEIPTACFGLPLVQFLYFWSDSKTRVNELKSFMHSSTDQAFARWNSLLINNGLSERADFLFPFGGE